MGKSVYVSQSEGSNGNSGLSAGQAKQTWAAGYGLLTAGSNDELVILDEYTLEDGESFTVQKPGISAVAPLTIRGQPNGSGDRPTLYREGAGYVFRLHSDPHFSDYVCIRDLVIHGQGNAGGGGISIYTTGGGILIDNVTMHDLRLNAINMTGESGTNLDGVDIIRCHIFDVARTDGGPHVQGIYSEYCRNIRLIESLIDHCGRSDDNGMGTIYNHNWYVHSSCHNATSLNSITARSSATGFQHRCNEQHAIGNLVLDCALGITFGHDDYAASFPTRAVSGTCIGNAVIGATDISDTEPRKGPGLAFGLANGLVFSDNIIAHCLSTDTPAFATDRPSLNVTAMGTVVENWGGPAYRVDGTANPNAPTVNVAAPLNRAVPTIADYLTSIGKDPGGDPHDTFLTYCRDNTRANWDPRYTAAAVNAFLRQGTESRRSWRFAQCDG